jgi:phosphoserine phosphatase
MPEFRWRLVTFDIDGTLTRIHGWRALARARGREAEYEERTRRYGAGEVGEDEHLAHLLSFAVGLTPDALARLLESTPKLAGIAETVAALHARGCRAALLTHNPTYVTEWYRARFGFDAASGTEVPVAADGRVLPPGPVRADKPGGLRLLLDRLSVPAELTAHVGDGRADAWVFGHVGGGIALNAELPEVERAADAALHTQDLRDIVPVLERLRPRAVR